MRLSLTDQASECFLMKTHAYFTCIQTTLRGPHHMGRKLVKHRKPRGMHIWNADMFERTKTHTRTFVNTANGIAIMVCIAIRQPTKQTNIDSIDLGVEFCQM